MGKNRLLRGSSLVQLGLMAAEMLLVGQAARRVGKRMIGPYVGRAVVMVAGLMACVVCAALAVALGSAALFGWMLGMGELAALVLAGVAFVMALMAAAGAFVAARAKATVEAYDDLAADEDEPPLAKVLRSPLEGLRDAEAGVEGWARDVRNAFNRGWDRAG